MAGRPNRNIPSSPAFGGILLSIIRGNTRGSKIAEDLNKEHPTITEQLQLLEGEGWIKRDKKTKEIYVNYEKLINYYAEKFGLDKNFLRENIKETLAMLAAIYEQITIDGIGTIFLFSGAIDTIAKSRISWVEAVKMATKKVVRPEVAEAIKKAGVKPRKL